MKRFFTFLLGLAVVSGTLFAQESLGIQYGPWVTATSENSFTVLWMTETPGLAWVELEDGSRIYQEFAGRRIFERLHKVEVTGLAKGKEYTYRVGGAPLADDSDPYEPKFMEDRLSAPYTSRTYDNSAAQCVFSVVNDMHMHLSRFSRLVAGIDAKSTDFIFLNGDITTAGNYCLDTLVRYNIEPLKGYAESIPVWFARGNHEVRGNAPRLISEVFPTPTGKFYYSFRQGPGAFVVMDAAETSRRRSIAFSGSEYFGD